MPEGDANNLAALVARLIQDNAKLKAEVAQLAQRVAALEAKEQSRGYRPLNMEVK